MVTKDLSKSDNSALTHECAACKNRFFHHKRNNSDESKYLHLQFSIIARRRDIYWRSAQRAHSSQRKHVNLDPTSCTREEQFLSRLHRMGTRPHNSACTACSRTTFLFQFPLNLHSHSASQIHAIVDVRYMGFFNKKEEAGFHRQKIPIRWPGIFNKHKSLSEKVFDRTRSL